MLESEQRGLLQQPKVKRKRWGWKNDYNNQSETRACDDVKEDGAKRRETADTSVSKFWAF